MAYGIFCQARVCFRPHISARRIIFFKKPTKNTWLKCVILRCVELAT
jgi:hypothetical protein